MLIVFSLVGYVTKVAILAAFHGVAMPTGPEDLFQFAFVPEPNDRLAELAQQVAEDEDWDYHNTPTQHPRPILYNYIRYTYRRVAEELKIALSEDGQYCCFNTSLVTEAQEPIYAAFETNRNPGAQPWFFRDWLHKGRWELNRFPELPDLAHYFDDPSCLVFDMRKDFRVNVEHIIVETPRDRFPEPYR